MSENNGQGPVAAASSRPMRIALLAGPMVPVPPVAYGGTERVVAALATELGKRGHDVTVFASGDSTVDARLRPVVERALWQAGYRGDVSAHMLRAVARCWAEADRFDIVHAHVESFGFPFARYAPVPVVTTLHGRLDVAGMPELLDEFSDIPLVAISQSQKRWAPDANWVAVVPNGLPLEHMPTSRYVDDNLLLVGRIAREKGVAESVELARRVGLPLKIVAKVHDPLEIALYEEIVRPAVAAGGVEFLGELPPSARDPLFASAKATLMVGAWPEPFGLVAIESLAAGTPVIARRAGALPEIVEHGVDGYLVDDLDEAAHAVRLLDRLDRSRIRRRAIERYSASRMADRYLAAYESVLRDAGDLRRTTLVAGGGGAARPSRGAGPEPMALHPASNGGGRGSRTRLRRSRRNGAEQVVEHGAT
ncbi:MAG TPA: glycosyltransferase family 4 protein [Candidatus Limnocylindrales bacterium]|nr:glycosyltransferase family 4 protein [Candidatus Limnocylindrales bacterium]